MDYIVEDINNGKVINKVYAKWNKIKTKKQYDAFTTKIETLRFGTFKNFTIIEAMQGFDIITKHTHLAEEFKFECSQILKRQV